MSPGKLVRNLVIFGCPVIDSSSYILYHCLDFRANDSVIMSYLKGERVIRVDSKGLGAFAPHLPPVDGQTATRRCGEGV